LTLTKAAKRSNIDARPIQVTLEDLDHMNSLGMPKKFTTKISLCSLWILLVCIEPNAVEKFTMGSNTWLLTKRFVKQRRARTSDAQYVDHGLGLDARSRADFKPGPPRPLKCQLSRS